MLRSRPARVSLLVAFTLIVTCLPVVGTGAWTAPAGQATPTSGEGDQLTPVLQSVPSPPRWFMGSDGRVHLVYELMLTNPTSIPVSVTSVEVLDPATGQTVASIDGDDLAASMSLVGSPAEPTTELPPSSIGFVWADLTFERPDELPASITHRLTVAVPPGLPIPESVTSTGAPAVVDLRPPVVIGPPLIGPGWLALGSCCDGPHRRAFQPINGGLYLAQRFAIDFNVLDESGFLVTGDQGLNESYPSFGQPVIAVADAEVVAAVDRYPDQTPLDPQGVTLENADGNYVILDLGDGRFANYAHLKAGSVTVEAGDRVRKGEQIGELGNSGSSTGAHLHFHVMDAPSPLVADGLPYVFDQFELEGQTPSVDEVIALAEAGEPVPVDSASAGFRQDELPLGRDVVTFPAP